MRGISVPTSAALMSKFPFDPLMDPKKTRHEDLHGDRDLIYYSTVTDFAKLRGWSMLRFLLFAT
jgi:hypothetical protein